MNRFSKNAILTAVVLLLTILLAVFLFLNVKYMKLSTDLFNETNEEVSKSFAKTYPQAMVENIWISYKDKIQKDGRTIDRSRDYLTTSEGQSYSMLRAVWMDDKEVFDRVLKWTNNNLRKRETDKLFAWKWGKNADGSWDIMKSEGGINTASDADQDIALALIFAHSRWNDERYLDQAIEVLNEIWRVEVITINNRPYLVAGNWAVSEEKPTINPSYLSPAYYPIFAKVNPQNDWMALRETSYEVINKSTELPLDKETSANLTPDWVSIDPVSGEIVPSINEDKLTDFSDDAYRTIWRVGLDWQWHKNQQALDYLKKLSFLSQEWETKKLIYRAYEHDGDIVFKEESNSMYANILPYFKYVDTANAEDVYFKKIVSLYNPDTEDFRDDIGYYSQNWVWFGMAFYQDQLPMLYKGAL